VHLDLGGVPVTLIDTAGMREQAEGIEAMGVERARAQAGLGDVVLWLEPVGSMRLDPPAEARRVMRVGTKVDLVDPVGGECGVGVSAKTGVGIENFVARLTARVTELAGASESVLISRARQRAAMSDCAFELRAFMAMGARADAELRAEHLRLALRALARLTGRVDVEEVLGEIFAGFCIGK
jgi:tRNA modification GTPase